MYITRDVLTIQFSIINDYVTLHFVNNYAQL